MQTIIYFVFLLKCSMCSFFSPLTFIHRDHFYQIFEKISSSPVHPLGSAPYLPLTDHLEDRLFVFYGFCNMGVVSFSRSLSTFISLQMGLAPGMKKPPGQKSIINQAQHLGYLEQHPFVKHKDEDLQKVGSMYVYTIYCVCTEKHWHICLILNLDDEGHLFRLVFTLDWQVMKYFLIVECCGCSLLKWCRVHLMLYHLLCWENHCLLICPSFGDLWRQM